MAPWITGLDGYGNPSSIHSLGRRARAGIDSARDSVAALLRCEYSEITFTSSGTEADNLAILGCLAASGSRKRLVTTTIEHHAVLHAAHRAEELGFEVTYVPVDADGMVHLDELERAISGDTALVSIMHANNEIGTIQPVREISRIAHDRGALFHTDAVQTAGLLKTDVAELGCDLLSLSGHKMYGPKGTAALYVRTGTPLSPMIVGGAQERERRAGTENVAGIVGFGAAAAISLQRRDQDADRLTAQRNTFVQDLRDSIPAVCLNGHPTQRLPGNVNISIEGIEGSTLLMNLDRNGVCAASGAACSSGSIEPSHVLRAIGLSPERAAGGVRFSLGRGTTDAKLKQVVSITSEIAQRLREPRHNV